MRLGDRTAQRHQTIARTAVVSSDYADFKTGQRVLTREGFPGVVTAVSDGPVPGNEEYEVTLDGGLGGGAYAPGELRSLDPPLAAEAAAKRKPNSGWQHGDDELENEDDESMSSEAADVHTAADDYPELGNILEERPDHEHVIPVTAARIDVPGEGNGPPKTYFENLGDVMDHFGRAPDRCACGKDVIWDEGDEVYLHIDYDTPVNDWTVVPEGRHGDEHHVGRKLIPVTDESEISRPGFGVEASWFSDHATDYINQHTPTDFRTDPEHAYSVDWCRFRRNSRCFFSHNVDEAATEQAGYVVWTPEDRGFCPRNTWDAQRACPIGEPGPLSGAPNAGPEATVSWEQGGQRFSALDDDREFGFHLTAAWRDVRAKAKRIKTEGGVRIIAAPTETDTTVTAEVKGDHHIYETTIMREPGKHAVAMWTCGCAWASYSWGRSGRWKRYEGRMCSHALALVYEVQAKGMFGKTILEDRVKPEWRMDPTIPVMQPQNYPKPKKRSASLEADAGLRPVCTDGDLEIAPAVLIAQGMLSQGYSPNDTLDTLIDMGLPNAVGMISEALSVKPFKAKVRGWVRKIVQIVNGNAVTETGEEVPLSQVYYPTYDPRLGLDPSLRDSVPHIAQGADTKGVMICFRVPDKLAHTLAELGTEDVSNIHITLAYFGKPDEIDPDQLRAAVRSFADTAPTLLAEVSGLGTFENGEENVLVATWDIPGIDRFRSDLVTHCEGFGQIPYSNHGFTPHATLSYGDKPFRTLPKLPDGVKERFAISDIWLTIGDEWEHFPLTPLGATTADLTSDWAEALTEGYESGEVDADAITWFAPSDAGQALGEQGAFSSRIQFHVNGVSEDVEEAADMAQSMVRTNGGEDVTIERESLSGDVTIATANDMSAWWAVDGAERMTNIPGIDPGSFAFEAARGEQFTEDEAWDNSSKYAAPNCRKCKGQGTYWIYMGPGQSGGMEVDQNAIHLCPCIRNKKGFIPGSVYGGVKKLEGELHDEPEPALPETDGADEDEEVKPGDPKLGWLMSGEGGQDRSNSEIAAMAQRFLKEGAKAFTPAEQRQIIDEGEGVLATNFDSLDITGTHYEALEAALAAEEDDEELLFG